MPSGPTTHASSPGASAPRRSVPGPIASSRNSSRPSARAADRERPPQVRAPGVAAPARGRGQHVELPRQRRRAGLVLDRDQVVGADALVGDHAARRAGRTARACAALFRRREPRLELDRAHEATGGVSATGRRAAGARAAPAASAHRDASFAPIARAAAEAPVIVVMQGMLRSIAARRISQPSARAPRPAGVLITMSTSPDRIASATLRRPLADLLQLLDRDAHRADRRGGPCGGEHPKPEIVHAGGELRGRRLVRVADAR